MIIPEACTDSVSPSSLIISRSVNSKFVAISCILSYISLSIVAKNKITSEFSLRKDPYTRVSSFHMGVDIRGNIGDPVFSAADGEVLRAEYFGGYGNLIVIKHSNKHTTWYAHLSSIDVDVGDHVKKGE